VRSRDVVFVEDQTIEDIGKVEKSKSQIDNLVDLDPVPSAPTPDAVDVENQADI
jgi:hypothetical protein